MNFVDNEELIEKAKIAQRNAYAPYSNFHVGSALLCKGGEIFTGCNVENRSFTPTVCAERSAIFSAIASGTRNFEKIAVVGEAIDFTYPCGVCLQVISEFVEDDFPVILQNNNGEIREFALKELLPLTFRLEERTTK